MQPVIRRTFTPLIHIDLAYYYPRLSDWYLTAEKETYQWLVDNVDPNWVCVEVGGHIGESAMLMSLLAARVISFEACKETAEMFRNNIEYNQYAGNGEFLNVELVVRPVGNVDGIAPGKLWLTGKDDKFGETEGEFNFITLDKFARLRKDITWVSLIFMDADGWDYDVLLGAEFLIQKCRPYIIMEANYALKWRGHSITEVNDWAEMHDYNCKFLDAGCPGNLLMSPRPQDVEFYPVYVSE